MKTRVAAVSSESKASPVRHLWLFWVAAAIVGARAADAQGADEDKLWITVHAPRVSAEPVGRAASGATIELVSLVNRVSYSDLDLTMYVDVMELETRIHEAAQMACEQLAALRPLGGHDTPACAEQAVNGAMEQAKRLVAAANP
jgi:UrcA family protein